MKLSTKILAVVLGSAIAVAFVVGVASTASAAGYVFTKNLTVGSRGADVTALQTVVGVTPETGYFGAITKAAVIKFQVANGISGTGFVGPLTIAALNGAAPVATTGALCPNGMTLASNCSQAPGTTVTVALCPNGMTIASNCSAAPSGTVSTNGAEGTLSVTQTNAGLPSSIYEGNTQVGVLAFKVEAKNSNITVQRVKVDLGTATSIYTKRFSRIYVLDGSTVLASSDLNSNTVTKDSGRYYITLTGMNLVVPKDGTKVLTIAVDVNSSVDSTYRTSSYASVFSLAGTTDGVRGVDGAGLNQYAGGTSITRTVSTISTALVDAANLKLSLDSNNQKAVQVIASDGVDKNEKDKVTLLNFDLKADKDNILVTDLATTLSGTAVSNGNVSTVYLFDGSNEVANASIGAGGVATFSDIVVNVSNNTTKVLTIKADIRNATSSKTLAAAVSNSQVTAENSRGDSLVSGSTITGGPATGESMTINKSGAVVTLLSTKTAVSTNTDAGISTSTLTGTFTYLVTASGADVVLGSTGSTTMAFASSSGYTVYKDGAVIAQNALPVISGVSFSTPDQGVTVDSANNSFTIADGNQATIVVDVRLVGSTYLGTHTYSIQTAALNVNNTLVTFMNGQSAWRTTGVTLP